MKNGIRVLQIFMNTDLRNGDVGLEKLLRKDYGFTRTKLKGGEVFVFWNGKRNLVKIMSADSILVQRLGGKRRWDPAVDRNELFVLIGKAFGLSWSVSKQVYELVKQGGDIKR